MISFVSFCSLIFCTFCLRFGCLGKFNEMIWYRVCVHKTCKWHFKSIHFRSLNNELVSVNHVLAFTFQHNFTFSKWIQKNYITWNWLKGTFPISVVNFQFGKGGKTHSGNILTNHLSFPFKSHNFSLIASYLLNMANVQKFSICFSGKILNSISFIILNC